MYRQRMHTAVELTLEQIIQRAMPVDAGLLLELRRNHDHFEVTLRTFRYAVVPAFIDNLEMQQLQCVTQGLLYALCTAWHVEPMLLLVVVSKGGRL